MISYANVIMINWLLKFQRMGLSSMVFLCPQTIIAAAAAPDTRWEEDGIKLRSAAISLSVA